jgi:3-hydroxyisobutyrate dehydrogenase-like beta-hydroxyacid dehydrogenase
VTNQRVGFIGLGSQGAPMARRISEAGFALSIWARRQASLDAFADTAVTVRASPADLGACCDVVGICVVSDADVEDVLLRPDGVLAGMAAGGIVAVHSTVHPDTCKRLAQAAANRGVGFVDAPVSGGGVAAAERRLLVMVGGEDGLVERCRPVFEAFAGAIIHLGGVGSGQIAKVLNNLVFTAHIAVALDTFSFAERLGVDRAALAQVLSKGSGASFAATVVGSADATSGLRRAASLLRKDVDIALDVGQQRGAGPAATLATLAEAALAALAEPGSHLGAC